MKVCKFEGCGEKSRSRGWCQKHYQRWYFYGSPLTTFQNHRPYKMSLVELIDFEVGRAVRTKDGCLETQAFVNKKGYARVRFGNRSCNLHRLVLEEGLGRSLIKEEIACHRCNNTRCIDIDHLYLGNPQTNMDDKVASDRHVYGSAHKGSKLNEEKVIEIRRLHATGRFNAVQLGRKFDISHYQIYRVVNLVAWKHC